MLLRLSCVLCCVYRAKPINCSFLLYVCTIKTHRLFKKNTHKKQNWFFTPYRTRSRCSNRFICLAQSFHLIIDRWQRGGGGNAFCAFFRYIYVFLHTHITRTLLYDAEHHVPKYGYAPRMHWLRTNVVCGPSNQIRAKENFRHF